MVKSFHCACLEDLEKKQDLKARITVTLSVVSKEGWKKSLSCSPRICPFCGRPVKRSSKEERHD